MSDELELVAGLPLHVANDFAGLAQRALVKVNDKLKLIGQKKGAD